MVKLCSFDVGIKNLAYCVIQKENNVCKIVSWGKIDLTNDILLKCNYVMKKKGVCKNNSTYVGTTSTGDTQYYCGTHKHFYKPYPDDHIDKMFTTTTKAKCEYVCKNTQMCGKNTVYTDNNKMYCTAHMKTVKNNFIKNYSIKKIKKIKCTDNDLQLMAVKMFKTFDSIPSLLDVDTVLIENQPALKGITMKTVATFIFSYFIIRGIVDKTSINNVNFSSATNKLKVHEDYTDKVVNKIVKGCKIHSMIEKLVDTYSKNLVEFNIVPVVARYLIDKKNVVDNIDKYRGTVEKDVMLKLFVYVEKDKKNYELGKLLSVVYTEVLIDGTEWENVLDKHKKKDDLCDAYLQGYYYLR